jgi:uncharacterized protein YegP (UPF0339 family)
VNNPRAVIKKANATPQTGEAWYFVVQAANGEAIATSELYTRKEDAERGIYDLRNTVESKAFTVEHG